MEWAKTGGRYFHGIIKLERKNYEEIREDAGKRKMEPPWSFETARPM
jgi:hypothetical protein